MQNKISSHLPEVTTYNMKVNESVLKGKSRSSLGVYTNKVFNIGNSRNKAGIRSGAQNNLMLRSDISDSSLISSPSKFK